MSIQQSTVDKIQSKVKGTGVTGFRSGDSVAVILCFPYRHKSGHYLCQHPVSIYRSKDGTEHISWYSFAKHRKDFHRVSDKAFNFLDRYEFRPLAAIRFLEEQEARQAVVNEWYKELTAERNHLKEKLKELEKPDNLNVDPGVPPSLISAA